jgi:tRNA threonylcarbamoyladenosine biosynthesis protein TsaE
MEVLIESPEQLQAWMPTFFQLVEGRRKFVLYGDIGAGKTTFVQAFCQELGVKDAVTSPTFALVNAYSFAQNAEQEAFVYHLDLYRLETVEEALDIGIEDYLYDENYCLVEWPQLIEGLLPEDVVRIKLEILEHSKRKLVLLLG